MLNDVLKKGLKFDFCVLIGCVVLYIREQRWSKKAGIMLRKQDFNEDDIPVSATSHWRWFISLDILHENLCFPHQAESQESCLYSILPLSETMLILKLPGAIDESRLSFLALFFSLYHRLLSL